MVFLNFFVKSIVYIDKFVRILSINDIAVVQQGEFPDIPVFVIEILPVHVHIVLLLSEPCFRICFKDCFLNVLPNVSNRK